MNAELVSNDISQTVSGEAATRGSNGSISLATAIFMTFPNQ